MRKYSRKHGWMELRSYAPGDGGIAFTWVTEINPLGDSLDEPVTESDVSMWLMEDDNKSRFKEWDIVIFYKPHTDKRYWDVRLGQLVKRVAKLHNKLVIQGDDEVYEYVYHGPEDDVHYHDGNTDFYFADGRTKTKVKNGNTILALLFFLNHETDFEKSGHTTKGPV